MILLWPPTNIELDYLAKVITGVMFKDGIETTKPDQLAA